MHRSVIPAQAGIHKPVASIASLWIPACARNDGDGFCQTCSMDFVNCTPKVGHSLTRRFHFVQCIYTLIFMH